MLMILLALILVRDVTDVTSLPLLRRKHGADVRAQSTALRRMTPVAEEEAAAAPLE
jgi:hypothetical protein